MSNLEILQALVFEPRKAFAEIAERPRYWFPLLLLFIATLATTIWYLSIVDIGWVADRQLRHNAFARSLTEDQIAQQVQMAQGRRGLQIGITVVGTAIVLPIALMIAALYNFLVGKIVSFERSFRQWFSFTAWVAMPLVVAAIPAALVLATSETTEIAQESLKPLSLNSLFFHRAIGEPGFSLFSSLDLFQLLTLYLSLVGVKVWSGRSWLFSALFVGIPWGLIYGLWAWFSLR
jgi:Yip1 domain